MLILLWVTCIHFDSPILNVSSVLSSALAIECLQCSGRTENDQLVSGVLNCVLRSEAIQSSTCPDGFDRCYVRAEQAEHVSGAGNITCKWRYTAVVWWYWSSYFKQCMKWFEDVAPVTFQASFANPMDTGRILKSNSVSKHAKTTVATLLHQVGLWLLLWAHIYFCFTWFSKSSSLPRL